MINDPQWSSAGPFAGEHPHRGRRKTRIRVATSGWIPVIRRLVELRVESPSLLLVFGRYIAMEATFINL